jgi:hypothetical protein
MTFVWFIVWVIWNAVGDREPLVADPVNFWLGSLLLVVALDLAGNHATSGRRR